MITNNFDKIRKNITINMEKRVLEKKIKCNYKLDLDVKINNIKKYSNNISESNFSYSNFIKCVFENMYFEECIFSGSEFIKCDFKGVVFKDCNFSINECSIFNGNTQFIDCIFINCNLSKSIFNNVKMCKCKFISIDLREVIINDSLIKNMHISDCDCRSFSIINSSIESLDFEDEYLSKFNEDTFIDIIRKDKKDKYYYEKSFRIYKCLFSKFESNRLLSNAGEYYYLYKITELRTLTGINKIKSYIFWLLCGYGERPTYALISSIEIILIFTILYMFTGLNIEGNLIDYNLGFLLTFPMENLVSDFFKSLYFSIVTFTTVGYGDITPTGYSLLLSGIEMFLGVTMVGVWTATLARKITR